MFFKKHSSIDEHYPRARKTLERYRNCYIQQIVSIVYTQAQAVIKVAKLLLMMVLFMGIPYSSYTIAAANATSAAYVGEDSSNNISIVGHNDENVNASRRIAHHIDSTNNLPTTESENTEKSPSEVQKAICTVTAGDVSASAEAVTTKTLKGVCGSAEMNMAIRNLEIKIIEELREVKHLIKKYLTNSTNITEDVQSMSLSEMYNQSVVMDSISTRIIQNKTKLRTDIKDKTKQVEPKVKSLPHKFTIDEREQEVFKFNNTMLSDRDLKVFTYYWKLENFSQHISSIESHTIESQIFSIKGKPLHIKASFQHLHRDFLYLQLENAPFNITSNQNNIILDTGGLFKKISDDKVSFKHKISILNQSNQRSHDLVSQEFFNLETGFLIPNSALLGSFYVKNNSLLIQIFMYL